MTSHNGEILLLFYFFHSNLSSRTGEGVMILNERERLIQEKWQAMNPTQKLADWAKRHEYSIILGSWALTLGVAGAIISRDK